jgi:hypothetical protein
MVRPQLKAGVVAVEFVELSPYIPMKSCEHVVMSTTLGHYSSAHSKLHITLYST